MNIYLDFDRTLYNTDKVYNDMLVILQKYKITKKIIKKYKELFFQEPFLYNLFKIISYICNEEELLNQILNELNDILNDWKKYLYDDVFDFLKSLKEKGYIINILTYGDLDFQIAKLHCISLNDYIDNIIVTNKYKYNININYENSIFIDDNPRDIQGLYENKAKKVIRIRRPKTKYFHEKIQLSNIECYGSLKEIELKYL